MSLAWSLNQSRSPIFHPNRVCDSQEKRGTDSIQTEVVCNEEKQGKSRIKIDMGENMQC